MLAWLGLRGCCVRKRARGLWKLGELHWGTGHEGKWCPGSKDAEGKDGVSLKTDSPSVHSFSQQSPGYRTFQLQKPLFAPCCPSRAKAPSSGFRFLRLEGPSRTFKAVRAPLPATAASWVPGTYPLRTPRTKTAAFSL